jgi:hypothetical protein
MLSKGLFPKGAADYVPPPWLVPEKRAGYIISILIRPHLINSSYGTEVDGRSIKPFSPCPIGTGQLLRIAGFSYHLVEKLQQIELFETP